MYEGFVDPFVFLLPGDLVECVFVEKYFFASFGVAALGSLLALELLARRTHKSGFYNIMLLVLAAFFMGGVGMWAMHYLSDMGTKTGWGDNSYQVVQAPFYVVASLVAPILAYLGVFSMLGASERPVIGRVVAAGILSGIVSVGEHVLANRGVSNYDLTYSIPFLAGAGAMAVVVNIWVYYSIFWIRRHFETRWYKQVYMAFFSACCLCGTHWFTLLGTNHFYKKDKTFAANFRFRNIIAAMVGISTGLAIAALVILVVYGGRRDRRTKSRTASITLASATFTYDGRIMVKPDGTLPLKVICRNYDDKTFDDALDVEHPVFLWMFRVAMNWDSIAGVVGLLKFHRRELVRKQEEEICYWDDRTFSTWFRETFAITANKLAASMSIPITKLGTLHEKIYMTGNPLQHKDERDGGPSTTTAAAEEAKRGARGRMLVLSRVISLEEAKSMEPMGFRFTKLEEVIEKLAWSTQSTKIDVSKYMEELQSRTMGVFTHRRDTGVYIGCFALRPNMSGNFSILVERECHSQIPMKRVYCQGLRLDQLEILKALDGKKLRDLLPIFEAKYQTMMAENMDEHMKGFFKAFSQTLQAIVKGIHPDLWKDATFIGTPTYFPCKMDKASNVMTKGGVAFGLRTMLSVHEVSHDSMPYDFVPFQIANIQQKTFPADVRHFLNSVLREFTTKARDAYHERQLERLDAKGLLPMLSRTWSNSKSSFNSSRRASEASGSTELSGSSSGKVRTNSTSSCPLSIPGRHGDWDPEIPNELEAKDPQGWLEKWYHETTMAAAKKGPMAAAIFGACRHRYGC